MLPRETENFLNSLAKKSQDQEPPIDLKQEAKELIEAEVEISPENFGDSRLRQPQSSWLERASRLVKEIIVKNFKQDRDNDRPSVSQNKFDQYYLDIITAYNDRDYKEVETEIKKIKEFLRKLVGSENIEENKKE